MTTPAAPTFTPAIFPPDDFGGTEHWFVFRKRELLVTADGQLPSKDELSPHELNPERSLYLGTLGEAHCFGAQVPEGSTAPDGMTYRDLIMLYASLEMTLHAVGGRAVQLVEWDRTHRLCGACGAPTDVSKIDRSRICSKCSLAQFPRLSPAIIVTVERENEILLARSPHFPPGIFSTIAGFVEPGESAEEAVAREVREEVGVEVGEVRYFASQPWPFPNSLMLGYTAVWKSGEIAIDGEEIEAAQWFRSDDMPTRFPGAISISQWLIDDFLKRCR